MSLWWKLTLSFQLYPLAIQAPHFPPTQGIARTYKAVYNTSQQELTKQTRGATHLVTIAPWVVLHTHVLVGILGAFLERGHVLPVLPMLHPEVIGIDAGEGQAGDNGARNGEYICRADRVPG